MEPDRTYITFRLDELRAEAAANRLARASSTRRGDARGACPGWRPPHISVRGIVILVLVDLASVERENAEQRPLPRAADLGRFAHAVGLDGPEYPQFHLSMVPDASKVDP